MRYDKRKKLMEEAARFRDRAGLGDAQGVALLWDCGRGHRWDDTLDQAQNIRCMNCASQRRENETKRLRDIAQVRGGSLETQAQTDATTPHAWQCAYGHRWRAHAHDAQRRWCAECARTVFAAYR
ncbi:hypothetical protein BVER_01948c [Candidatus Burkholderia verschuerenii]|uniref:Zinc-ribbon domain-containing protein n=2 Tax=Candidatus Burkholderia verschuerenii TaxID=242163 RepID=A0A0L0MIP7_9BURK|nr:hypothetical protein BVER_01948c [Candidatus Burkholderia verschuerenii]